MGTPETFRPLPPPQTYRGPWTGLDEQGTVHEGTVTQEARSMASAMQLACRKLARGPGVAGALVELTLKLRRVR